MAENSKIAWTNHTFNAWRGCTKISPGCTHCYAETMSHRNPKVLGEWGDNGKRSIAGESYWRLPLKWDRDAAEAGERPRVFCLSLGDFAEERPELVEPRLRLFKLIGATPHLDWLLLTKRPEVAAEHWPYWAGLAAAGALESGRAIGPGMRLEIPNVWLGVSVEDQQRADERVPILLRIPAMVRFLSIEPLLGPVDVSKFLWPTRWHWDAAYPSPESALHAGAYAEPRRQALVHADGRFVDWVIVGGESGPHARPCNLGWVRSLVQQCKDASVACFVKQLGSAPRITWRELDCHPGTIDRLPLRDPNGGDMEEWPEDLRIREFPRNGQRHPLPRLHHADRRR